MLVSEVLSRINSAISSPDTIRAVTPIFTNKLKVGILQEALDTYASTTKAFEGVHSEVLYTNSRTVNAPLDAIRGAAYRSAYILRDSIKYSLYFRDTDSLNRDYAMEEYSGIPEYFNVWGGEIYVYPKSSFQTKSTNLKGGISDTMTTIELISGNGFPSLDGRITIGNEKIRYKYKEGSILHGCQRGIENTNPVAHDIGGDVRLNNFIAFYNRKHFKIPVDDFDAIPEAYLNREMEVHSEYMGAIIDMVAYKLLVLMDDYTRANNYKVDAAAFYQQAARDIQNNQDGGVSGGMILG